MGFVDTPFSLALFKYRLVVIFSLNCNTILSRPLSYSV